MSKRYLTFASKLFCTSLFLLLTYLLPAQIITTVAGGNIGDGKLATVAGITSVNGLAADTADNLYLLDNPNNRIRKVSAASGIITTYAGNGSFTISGDGGPAINAGLGTPSAFAIDLSGNIYLSYTSRIRKIDAATGIITQVAGIGQVMNPTSIATDMAGDVYFTEGHRIKKLAAATNTISTIAGTGTRGYTGDGGPALLAQFATPKSITLDGAGNIYVADNNNNVIRKITAATGIVSTYAGSGAQGFAGDGGPATAASLSYSYAITADATGNLYLSDNNRIRLVNATTGIINTIAGGAGVGYSGDGGNALLASFANPRYITVNAAGNLYINDFNNWVIRKVNAATNIITTMCGNHTMGTSGIGGPVSDAQLYGINNLAIDKQGNIYLGDIYNYKVYRIDALTDTISTVAGTGNQGLNHGNGGPATAANIHDPRGLVVDTSGNFYFLDYGIAVRKVNIATGIITTVAGNGVQYGYSGDGGPATSAKINRASGLAVDVYGNLYIADKENHVIRKVTAATGIITTVAGSGTAGYSGDGGPATAARLNMPFDVAVDLFGNIYISDNSNNVIRQVNAGTGIITTVAGTGAGGYSGDGGPGTAAMIRYPYGLTTDAAGNVYIADQFNQRVRKLAFGTGIITTITGTGNTIYNGDNIPASTASISNPTDVCFDPAGNLLIAELGSNRIRKIIYDTIPVDTIPGETIPAQRIAVNDLPSINNNTAIITTRLHPNPAHENVIVAVKGIIDGKTTISLTDMWGKVIISQQKTVQQNGTLTTILPLQQLPKGIYFVNVHANQRKEVHKLVVQ